VGSRGLPWHEAVSKVLPKPLSLEEIKAWRTRETAAGRPSSYEDFCRAHGHCLTCLGEGVTKNDNGVGFKGEMGDMIPIPPGECYRPRVWLDWRAS
jgi:hypothetical protein